MLADIYLSPRKTLRAILDSGSLLATVVIVAAAGTVSALLAHPGSSGSQYPDLASMGNAPAATLLWWLFLSALVHIGSRIFGGSSGFRSTLIGTGFAATPWLLGLLAVPLIAAAANAPLRDFDAAFNSIAVFRIILGVWSFGLLWLGVLEAQRFQRTRPELFALLAISAAPLLALLGLVATVIVIAIIIVSAF